MPKMSAMPPDKRFAYWDCAPALPRAPGRSPRFWLGSLLKFPLADQRAPVSLLQSRSANPLASYPLWEILSENRLTPATLFSSTEWRLHFRLGLFKMMFLGDKDWPQVVKTNHFLGHRYFTFGRPPGMVKFQQRYEKRHGNYDFSDDRLRDSVGIKPPKIGCLNGADNWRYHVGIC